MFLCEYNKLKSFVSTELSSCPPFSTIYIPSLNFIQKSPGFLRFTLRGFSLCSWFNFDDRPGDSSILSSGSDIEIRIITVSPIIQGRLIRNNNFFTTPLQYVYIAITPMHKFLFPQTPINNIGMITFILMLV